MPISQWWWHRGKEEYDKIHKDQGGFPDTENTQDQGAGCQGPSPPSALRLVPNSSAQFLNLKVKDTHTHLSRSPTFSFSIPEPRQTLSTNQENKKRASLPEQFGLEKRVVIWGDGASEAREGSGSPDPQARVRHRVGDRPVLFCAASARCFLPHPSPGPLLERPFPRRAPQL